MKALVVCMAVLSGIHGYAQAVKDTSFVKVRHLLDRHECRDAITYLHNTPIEFQQKDSFLLYLGEAEYACANYTKSLEGLSKYLEINDTNGRAFELMALCYMELGRYADAKKQIDLAIQNDPRRYQRNIFYYGTLQLSAGYPKEARKTLAKAMEQDPNNSELASLYAWTLMESEKQRDAYLFLKEFLTRNPDDCKANYMMGRLLGEHLAIFDLALDHLNRTLTSCNDSLAAESLLIIALVFDAMEENLPALQAYNELLELDPTHPQGLLNAGIFKTGMLLTGEAISHFETYIALHGPSQTAYFQMGLCYELEEKHRDAATQYTEAIRLDSMDTDAWFNRANAYISLNQLDLAIVDLSKVIEMNPRHTDALFNRANTYYHKANYRASEKDLTAHLMLESKDANAYFLRGHARYYGDNPHGACADWKQCLQLGRKDLWKKVRSICK